MYDHIRGRTKVTQAKANRCAYAMALYMRRASAAVAAMVILMLLPYWHGFGRFDDNTDVLCEALFNGDTAAVEMSATQKPTVGIDARYDNFTCQQLSFTCEDE